MICVKYVKKFKYNSIRGTETLLSRFMPIFTLDLRVLNSYVLQEIIKSDDNLIEKEIVNGTRVTSMYKIAVTSCFHQIQLSSLLVIITSLSGLPGFSLAGVKGTIASVQSYPLGLLHTLYIFTKLFVVWLRFWYSNGLSMVLFLDDGLDLI